jgi:hypothetical protein
LSADHFAQLRGRLGGLATSARYDSKNQTAAARASFLRRFEDEVDPSRILPEDERQRRAEAARRFYMARLSLASAKARAKRRGGPR